MKQALQLRVGQQLTMTPRLQQAIRLLQLSLPDLRQEIQEALDSNLMLEEQDEAERLDDCEDAGTLYELPETADPAADPEPEREVGSGDLATPDEWPIDAQWSDHYDGYPSLGGGNAAWEADRLDIFDRQSRTPTLRDHLDWQLNLSRLDDTSRAIAAAIVDAIDENGYCTTTPGGLLESFEGADLTPEDIQVVLHRVQSLDPPGVGARDLRECLLIQLRHIPAGDRARELAIAVCDRHFEALSRNDTQRIRRALRLSARAMAEVIALIRSLNPRPGAAIAGGELQYLIPDVVVHKRGRTWMVELNPETTPKLRVNPDYARLIRRADRSDDNLRLKSHLQEARWFINSLVSRNETLLKVATKIVERQGGFLEYGEEAMKPMVLRDIAEALGLHESTVSRVTTRKYMDTPRGTFELKYFFSSHVGWDWGGEHSSTAVRARIRKLVVAENPRRPLSDDKIATVLAGQGIRVARRTVAKYRESMGVPASSRRRRLG